MVGRARAVQITVYQGSQEASRAPALTLHNLTHAGLARDFATYHDRFKHADAAVEVAAGTGRRRSSNFWFLLVVPQGLRPFGRR